MILRNFKIPDETWVAIRELAEKQQPPSTTKEMIYELLSAALRAGVGGQEKSVVLGGEALAKIQEIVGKSVNSSAELVQQLTTLTNVGLPDGATLELSMDDLAYIKNICEGMGWYESPAQAVGKFIRDAVHRELYGSTIE